ncbi:hypothetical protein GCM10022380_22100 [Amycolatopsis tucumanensis]|uniref:Uncharacterized protein n=1 Tax=Amycolatopsis tucumanensis TaxID=401106 RepID=A0ABP7HXY6_9PSEU
MATSRVAGRLSAATGTPGGREPEPAPPRWPGRGRRHPAPNGKRSVAPSQVPRRGRLAQANPGRINPVS